MARPRKGAASAEASLVTAVLNQTKAAEDRHDINRTRFDKDYDTWRASQPKAPGVEPWQSKLRVPFGMQVIDSALVNIVSGKPRVLVKPRNPQSEAGAKAMQEVVDWHVAEDHLVEKQPGFVQQGLIYGVTIAKNDWLYREATRLGRSFQPDPITGQTFEQVGPQTVVTRDGPQFQPWSVYHAWWDPAGRDVDSCEYIVLRSYLSRDQLEQNRFNEDTGLGLYRNLEELYKTGNRAPQDMTAQERRNRAGKPREDLFEVLEVWMDDKVIVVGNRTVLLRAAENPFWHGKKPIVIAQPMPDGFEMVGISESERIHDLQQAAWTVKNMRFDNWHLTVMRGVTYREGGVTDPNSLQLRPRFKWAVTDHDDVKPFETAPLPPEAYREEESIKADMQLITGINPYISGSDLQSVDQNTATGVTALQEVASRLLRFKASQIHYKGYQRTFEQWGQMTQQFITPGTWVRVTDPQSREEGWRQYGPQDVVGEYQYVVEGSEESLSRQQERGEAIALLNAFAPLLQTGMVNIKPLLEKVALAYNFPNPEALFAAVQQQPLASPTPEKPNEPQTLTGGQQLDPALQQMIQRG